MDGYINYLKTTKFTTKEDIELVAADMIEKCSMSDDNIYLLSNEINRQISLKFDREMLKKHLFQYLFFSPIYNNNKFHQTKLKLTLGMRRTIHSVSVEPYESVSEEVSNLIDNLSYRMSSNLSSWDNEFLYLLTHLSYGESIVVESDTEEFLPGYSFSESSVNNDITNLIESAAEDDSLIDLFYEVSGVLTDLDLGLNISIDDCYYCEDSKTLEISHRYEMRDTFHLSLIKIDIGEGTIEAAIQNDHRKGIKPKVLVDKMINAFDTIIVKGKF